MCGRFTITLEAGEVQLQLALGEMPKDWRPRFNVAPSQPIAVVTDPEKRKVEWMQWGLVPFWAKAAEIGNKLINARAETVAEKPAFRDAFKQHRCLILADGFYEWLKPGGRSGPSVPFYFHEQKKAPFTFGGLWDQWKDENGRVLNSCTIITCPANEVVRPVHHRMPVIFAEEARWAWLAQGTAPDLQFMLAPVRADFLVSYAVSRMVNSPGNDSPACLERAEEQGRLF
jgi:putative SOS response-associated peptidase YedK